MLVHRLCIYPLLFSFALAKIGDVCRSSGGSGTCKAESSCSTGFTVVGACPNDPTDVKCCIQASCKDKPGQCLDKTRVACTGGVFKAGLCPGRDNVQCCQKATTEPEPPSPPAPKPTDSFVAYIRRLYDLAKQYGGDRPANQLVMEWLRHSEYNSLEWKTLIGGVDDDFTTFVEKAGVTALAGFRDPEYDIDVKASHLGACMNGVFLKGQASGTDTNRADVTGWGGDWMTFYGEWRRDHDDQPKGGKYCLDHMCNAVDDTTFKLRDLIEDADCYNIGMRLRANPSLSIADEFERTFAGGYKSRMKKFIEGRFGDRGKAQAVAKSMLPPGDDVIINTGRIRLVQQQGGFLVKLPLWLSDDELDDLTKGFADRLFGIVQLENLASQ
ncbi:MAG: hypothetical protein L6R37_007806 [Teloschistes peruensis]|nr:MAG: hypothetical protein L6R37_007806 [Teloschistes peruensis]